MSEIITGSYLESCPFCGGIAKLESWDMSSFEMLAMNDGSTKWYGVFCDECLAQGPDCTSAEQAVSKWNRRANITD